MFWNLLEKYSTQTALISPEYEHISYECLAHLADNAGFHGGVRRLALIEMDNSVASIAAYLGALRAGHAIILTNAGSPTALEALIERYDPELVWTQQPKFDVRALSPQNALHSDVAILTDAGNPPAREALIERHDPELVWTQQREVDVRALSPQNALHSDVAIMLSTSGTTGSPKLVRLSAASLEANARSIADYLAIDGEVRAVTTLPPAYSYGLSVINSHLAAGAALVLTDMSVTDRDFAELLSRFGVTSMAGVPYTYELLEATGLIDALPASMKILTQAGGRLAPERIERIRKAAEQQGASFFVMYGQTEATARMSYVPPDQLVSFPDCIGRPIPGGRFSFRDPETNATADGAGELIYHGPNVMMGYANTREDLARGHELDALATGDLAEIAAPGVYRITGRKSRFLKIFGLRIALDEVEREASRRGWTAVATGDDTCITVAIEGPQDPAPLADQLAQHFGLPANRVVAVSFPSLPRLDNGKIDYRAVMTAASCTPEGNDQGEAPLAAYTAFLARLARKPAVATSMSFEAIGGDSLNYVEGSIILERAFGRVPQGWEAMTLDDLAAIAPSADVPMPRGAPPKTLDTRYIQAMRTIAILLVVGAHAKEPFRGTAGSPPLISFTHVNVIFIFVAGYLFQYLLTSFHYSSYLRVKLKTVILPYITISIPAIAMYMVGMKDLSTLGAPSWVDSPHEWVGYMLVTGTHLGPLWFIPMIAIVYIASPLLKAMDDRPNLYWSIFPLLLLSAFVGRSATDNNPLQAFVFYLPVYIIGMWSSRYRDRLLPVLQRNWPPLLAALLLPALVYVGEKGAQELSFISKILFSMGLLGLLSRVSAKLSKTFDWIGDLSFGIYFVHGYIAAVFLILMRKHVVVYGVFEYLFVLTVIFAGSTAVVLAAKRLLGSRSRMIIGA